MPSIDDRYSVEMQFRNEDFQRDVTDSIRSVEELKKSLQFDGVDSNLDDIGKSINKLNFNGFTKSIEQVSHGFTTMEIAAATAVANITNRVVDFGIDAAKSLSIDNYIAGWSKYESKAASVQTIMNSTGMSMLEVNQYLNKLMWYSDETSYSFTDMTSALGTMLASGGDIKKLVPMIEGIANATAYAGKGTSEFSRVLYNLNQSYSGGYLTNMDWKSVALAGVNSKELMQTLIDTGVQMKKIKKDSVTTATFASSLSKKWLTADVMEAGFSAWAEATERAYELVQSGEFETASEAYASLSDEMEGYAIKAAKAAQEAKTFGEAIASVKDASATKFMTTFEYIFGDYEQAKVMWTELANNLWTIFASPLDDLNDLIGDIFQDKKWQDFNNMLEVPNLDKLQNSIIAIGKENGFVTDKMVKEATMFSELLTDGWLNEETFLQGLDRYVSDQQKAIDDLIDTWAPWQKSYYLQGGKKITDLTDYQLKQVNLTRAEAQELYDNLELAIKAREKYQKLMDEDSVGALDTLFKDVATEKGFTKVREIFSNLAEIGINLGDSFKVAWETIFPVDVKAKAEKFLSILDGIKERTGNLAESLSIRGEDGTIKPEEEWTPLQKAIQSFAKVVNIAKKAFSSLGSIFSYIGDKFAWVREKASAALGFIGGKLSDGIDFLDNSDVFDKFAIVVCNAIDDAYTAVSNFWDNLKSNKILANVKNTIADFIFGNELTGEKTIGQKLSDIFTDVTEFFGPTVSGIGQAISFIWNLITSKPITDVLVGLGEAFGTFLGAVLDRLSGLEIGDVFQSIEGLFLMLIELFTTDKIASLVLNFKWAVESIGDICDNLVFTLKAFAANLQAKAILDVAKAFALLAGAFFILSLVKPEDTVRTVVMFGVVAAAIAVVFSLVNKSFSQVTTIMKGATSMGDACTKFFTVLNNFGYQLSRAAMKFASSAGLAMIIVAAAVSIGIIVDALIGIMDASSKGDIWQALVVVGIIAAVMTGIAMALMTMMNKVPATDFSGFMNNITMSEWLSDLAKCISIMCDTVKQFAEFPDQGSLFTAVVMFIAIMVLFEHLIKTMGQFPVGNDLTNIFIWGLMLGMFLMMKGIAAVASSGDTMAVATALGAMVAVVVMIRWLLKEIADTKDVSTKQILLVVAISGALIILAGVIALLGALSIMSLAGLFILLAAIALIGLMVVGLSAIKPETLNKVCNAMLKIAAALIGISIAMTILGASMLIFATALVLMNGLNVATLIVSFVGFAITIGLIAAMFKMLASSSLQCLAIAAAIAIVCVGIFALSAAFALLAGTNPIQLLGSIIVVVGALMLLTAICYLIADGALAAKIAIGAGMFLMLGVAMLAIAASCALLARVDPEKIAVALIILSGALVIFAGVAALIGAGAPLITAGAGAMIALAGAITSLAFSVLIAAAVVMLIDIAVVALMNAFPNLGEALVQFMQSMIASREYLLSFLIVMAGLGLSFLAFGGMAGLGLIAFAVGLGACALAFVGFTLTGALASAVLFILATGVFALSTALTFLAAAIAMVLAALNLMGGSLLTAGANLISGLVNGILDAINLLTNPIGAVCNWVLGLFRGGLKEHSPSKATEEMGEDLDEGLANGIENGTGSIEDAVESVTEDTVNGFDVSKIGEYIGLDLGSYIGDGTTSALTDKLGNFDLASLTEGGFDLSKYTGDGNMLSMLTGGAGASGDTAASSFTSALSGGLSGSSMSQNIPDDYFDSTYEKFTEAGTVSGENFVEAISGKDDDASRAGKGVGAAAYDGLDTNWLHAKTIVSGIFFSDGFIQGILSRRQTIMSTVAQLGKDSVTTLNANIGAASPSKLTMRSGGWFGDGFLIGIQDSESGIFHEISTMGITSVDMLKQALMNVADGIENDDNFNPVITPVIDMTNVNASARQIGNLFSSNAAIRAQNALSADATIEQNQNGTTGSTIQYVQNNYSPKSLSRIEIYRQTRRQLLGVNGGIALV